MKKSAVIMLALAAAIGAQGALVDWQYKITGQSNNTVPGYIAYLIDATTWEGMTAVSQDALETAKLDKSTFVANGSAGKGSAKTYNFSTQTSIGEPDARALNVGDAASVDAYIVLFDTAANKYFVATDKMTLTSRGEADGKNDSGIAAKTAAAVSGGTWTQAVPEPTTVALLALGLAAVGLKRKVA